MTHEQRKLFAEGMINLANIVAGALIFGQMISGQGVDINVMVLGIIFTLIFYIGAYRFSNVRSQGN